MAVKEKELTTQQTAAVDVQHIIRRISPEGAPGTISAQEANNYILSFLQDGYVMENSTILGLEPGVVNVFYLLVKYA